MEKYQFFDVQKWASIVITIKSHEPTQHHQTSSELLLFVMVCYCDLQVTCHYSNAPMTYYARDLDRQSAIMEDHNYCCSSLTTPLPLVTVGSLSVNNVSEPTAVISGSVFPSRSSSSATSVAESLTTQLRRAGILVTLPTNTLSIPQIHLKRNLISMFV